MLVGLSGAGKSSVGRHLAQRLGWPLVDLDDEIARRAGMSVELIFDKLGEALFRRMEAAALSDALAAPPQVIATGGGAVVNRASRAAVLEKSTVVWLQVSPERSAERCARSEVRPLLADDPVRQLERLLEERRALYAEAHVAVDTDGKDAVQVASEVLCAIGELP